MQKSRRIIFIVYDGFELLDVSGPSSVFAAASWSAPRYGVKVVSAKGGHVRSFSNITIDTEPLEDLQLDRDDTLLMAGSLGHFQNEVIGDARLAELFTNAQEKTERYGSIGMGVFILAAYGLLDHKRVAAHWLSAHELAEKYGLLKVQPDALYIVDGRLWTSAGVTTGADMALAMLESDYGPEAMSTVARGLVMHTRRPGHQSQFSTLLQAQASGGNRFKSLIDRIEGSLSNPPKVSELANRMNMSERTFFRRFSAEYGMSPSKYIETRRLERAKSLLESGQAVKRAYIDLGFKSPTAFRAAFKAKYGVLPSQFASLVNSQHEPRG